MLSGYLLIQLAWCRWQNGSCLHTGERLNQTARREAEWRILIAMEVGESPEEI